MQQNPFETNPITQLALVVHDIEKVANAYATFLNCKVPEIAWTDPVEKAETEYRGNPTKKRAKLAFFDMGSLQLELIQPDHNPSTWREHLDEKGEGVHHIAFMVNGMRTILANLESNGMPLIQKASYTNGRYAYVDTSKDLKVLIELLENDTK